jgi:hypothetical protein
MLKERKGRRASRFLSVRPGKMNSEINAENAMKKQSDMRGPTRVSESETVTSNPSSAFTPSRPKGLQDHAHPGHLSRGVAESKASPVSDRPDAAVSSDHSSGRKPR